MLRRSTDTFSSCYSDPHVAIHGSLSFMTNFHALREVAQAYGGTGAW